MHAAVRLVVAVEVDAAQPHAPGHGFLEDARRDELATPSTVRTAPTLTDTTVPFDDTFTVHGYIDRFAASFGGGAQAGFGAVDARNARVAEPQPGVDGHLMRRNRRGEDRRHRCRRYHAGVRRRRETVLVLHAEEEGGQQRVRSVQAEAALDVELRLKWEFGGGRSSSRSARPRRSWRLRGCRRTD